MKTKKAEPKKVTPKKIVKKTTIVSRIRKVLKDQEDYIPGLEFLIEITAGNLYAYYLIMRDVEELESTEITELTREGNMKKRVHPAIRELREQSEMVRKCLRELKLTIATIEGIGEDDMDELIDTVNEVE